MADTDALENKILDFVLGGKGFDGSTADSAAQATWYVGLFTAAPNDSGGGTECTGGSYARVAVTNNLTNFPAASAGAKSNGTAVNFPTPTAGWGTATHAGLFTASTAGTLMKYAALTTSKTINTGDTVSFAIGDLDFTQD